MATRKRTPSRPSGTSTEGPIDSAPDAGLRGPRIVEGFVHFSPYDLTRYELAQHKVANALQALGLKKGEQREAQAAFVEAQRRLQGETAMLLGRAKETEAALLALQRSMEKEYGLDFKAISYDDVTGKLLLNEMPIPAKTED